MRAIAALLITLTLAIPTKAAASPFGTSFDLEWMDFNSSGALVQRVAVGQVGSDEIEFDINADVAAWSITLSHAFVNDLPKFYGGQETDQYHFTSLDFQGGAITGALVTVDGVTGFGTNWIELQPTGVRVHFIGST